MNSHPPPDAGFTAEQKHYLEGLLAALAAAPASSVASDDEADAASAPPAEPTVFGTPVSELSKPERWKLEQNPLDIWEKLVAHAEADAFPDAADTFRFKFHGLFYVAPAQDSFMLRLRLPAGEISATQLHGLADLAAQCGAGHADLTTRANLQIRELRPRDTIRVLMRIQELGLTARGSGADNVRNITASPTSGFDPAELLDVRPCARALHHYILNHRDLYGLPRKFNVSFDNGGSIAGATETNDIGFVAVRVDREIAGSDSDSAPIPPGVYFRVQLGGVTGHGDFARDCGLLLQPGESVAVAAAMIRVFNENADRANRRKARLKYLLERWGTERFLAATQARLAFPLRRAPLEACVPRRPPIKHGWLGVYKQARRGRNYLGAAPPAGRMTARQMHRLADLADHFGTGELRLTVWQSVLLPHVPDAFVETVRRSLQRLGFVTEPDNATGGIVACTGNKGCKYASTDTKGHAVALARHLSRRQFALSSAVNFHFTGCPHSCAQHYCGDIGFLGARLPDGGEGYHVVLGGGLADEQGLARELFRGVRAGEVPALTEKILRTFERRRAPGESFVQWVRRHSAGELQEILGAS